MKRISIINTSYLSDSKTMKLVNSFVEGMMSVDNNIMVKTINVSEWHISTCKGCGNCWFNKKDKCKFNDDFTKNIKIISETDLIIFSCPIWAGSGNHLFRNFTERLLSLVKPDFEYNGNRLGHKKKNNVILDSSILFSTCAMPGKHNFEPLIQHLLSFEYLADIKFVGAVLKPQSHEILYYSVEEINNLTEKCFLLGKDFQLNNTLNHSLLNKILQPNYSTEKYLELITKRQDGIRENYRIKQKSWKQFLKRN